MKLIDIQAVVIAVVALHTSVACAKHGSGQHSVVRRSHRHHSSAHVSRAERGHGIEPKNFEVEKRTNKCEFPTDAGLVPVTPNDANGGWAMSPDQCCEPGNYCPYACPPGQVMAQWDPDATAYSYPKSMNGGLYCDKHGKISKPFPNKPYCVDGTGNIGCKNKAKGNVAFCQTVLPGNEAMLIPTSIEDYAQLAVPGPDYWVGTAAHFYINPPGVSTEEACVWGSSQNPWGNWSPYLAGANTDKNGETFIKLAWNPIYLEPTTPFRDRMPTWGVEIVCDGHCNGLPCAIDPSRHKVNEIDGAATIGVGGAAFCVVTVPKGSNANFVVFEGGKNGPDDGKSTKSDSPKADSPKADSPKSDSPKSSALAPPPPSSSAPSSTPALTPTPTPTPTPKSTPTPTPTPTLQPTNTPISTTTTTPTPSSSSPLSFSSSAPESSSSTLPLPTPSSSSSVGTTSIFTSISLGITSSSSLSRPFTSSISSTPSSSLYSSASSTMFSKYRQDPTPLPSPTFSYKPHVFGEKNSTATSTAKAPNFAASGNASALNPTYTGPIAKLSSATRVASFTGIGLSALIAITALVI